MIARALCLLGWHAPDRDGLWNAGYCFTRCRRCGHDMVRSAFGEWHVPRDHRIVWRPPGDGRTHQIAGTALPAPDPAPPLRHQRVSPSAHTAARRDRRDPFDFGDLDAGAGATASAAPTRAQGGAPR